MLAVLAVVVTTVVVLLTAGLLGHLDRVAARVGDWWWRLRPRPVVAETVPLERLVADLRRLADLLERTYASDQPAKMERLTAAALAYDYVLLSACRTLDVPPPTSLPLGPLERLETEAALARQGLDW